MAFFRALADRHQFLPIWIFRGTRYRCRLRFVKWHIGRVVDCFPQGDVHRIWCGWIMLTAMLDHPVKG